MVKKILLTGATGFIGRHCLPILLEKKYEVHAVYLKSPCELLKGAYWHKVDLLDPKSVSMLVSKVRPTHLLHLAWYTEPKKYWSSPLNLDWVKASLGLLQEFHLHGGKRVVMAGTCAEYDWSYGYCSEKKTPLNPLTLYGACKHSLENIIRHYSMETGLSYAWGRIFYLYGPYENPDRLVPTVIKGLLKKKITKCSHGRQIRDFLYVKDVAEAFVLLLENNLQGSVNVASGHPISIKEVISKIAEKLDCKDLVRLGAVSSPNREPKVLVADTSRLHRELNWKPKYSIDQGLELTIQWWRK